MKTGRAKIKRHIAFRGIIIIQIADYLTETLEAKRQWNDISKVLKAKHFQSRVNIYPMNILFFLKKKSKIKIFSGRQMLRESNHQICFTRNTSKEVYKQTRNKRELPKSHNVYAYKLTTNTLSGEY